MPKQDSLEVLKKQISAGDICRLYIFHGAEAKLRCHYIAQIKKKLLPEGLDSFNLDVLQGRGLALGALSDAVESVPVMSGRRVVIVEDFDLHKIPEDSRPAWESFLSALPETVCLIFAYDILPYKPDGRTRLASVIEKHGLSVEFPLQDEQHLITWLMRHFSARGKTVDREVCRFLIFRCGSQMTALEGEVAKIAAYAADTRVTKKDVELVTVAVLEAAVFDLTGAVADGQIKKAAEILQILQTQREPPEMLLGALSKSLRGMYLASVAISTRRGARHVMEAMGYKSAYPAEKLMSSAKKRSPQWCRRALALCREADAALKGGSRDRDRILEWLIASIA